MDAFDLNERARKRRAPLLGRMMPRDTKRFVNNMFNLDLTYVTKRVIVMSQPTDGVRGVAGNSTRELKRFFDTRHPHSYMIYNLNTEPASKYDNSRFEGRVRSYGFREHSPPPLSTLFGLVQDMAAFLRQSPHSVVALHCRAGKGRSGTVACAWLLHSRVFKSADKAIDYYAAVRTHEGKGITLPSQVRYVRYMEEAESFGMPIANEIVINSIEFSGDLSGIRGPISVLLENGSKSCSLQFDTLQARGSFAGEALTEDVKMTVTDGRKAILFVLFFNTRFLLDTHVFNREELDGERDHKAFKLLPLDFAVTLKSTLTHLDSTQDMYRHFTNHIKHTNSASKLDFSTEAVDSEQAEGVSSASVMVRQLVVEDELPDDRRSQKIHRRPTGYLVRNRKSSALDERGSIDQTSDEKGNA
eukprot:c19531_g1_i1.p1 GENE.c19531_g1_i1~~c19531_g1_i1.p1  ORF type:complete len:415 (+),score=93.30 c19531_g1_i1:636-1880(+)